MKQETDWKQHRVDLKKMRERRRFQFREIIREFRGMGFTVEAVSEYQFRFNDAIDVFPSNRKYYDLTEKKWGNIREQGYREFLRSYFGLTK